MKLIIAFNEKYLELGSGQISRTWVRAVIPDGYDPRAVFRDYVRKRAACLLHITEEEAERLMDDEDDKVNIFNGCASIRNGDYDEFLRLEDIPENEDMSQNEEENDLEDSAHPSGKISMRIAYRASARFITHVCVDENTSSINDVIELGNEKFQEADIGDLENVDGEAVYIEDENGYRIWENGDILYKR